MLPGPLEKLRFATVLVGIFATSKHDVMIVHDCIILDPEFAQWVPGLIHHLIPCLLHAKAPRSLHENAAVTIGRIGLIQPTVVAPQLEVFAEQWCVLLFFLGQWL